MDAGVGLSSVAPRNATTQHQSSFEFGAFLNKAIVSIKDKLASMTVEETREGAVTVARSARL